MLPVTISQQTARRFILGRQGLWPGRRWAGRDGVAAAIHACEAVQLDPLNVVARSHDLVVWGRVWDYTPADLEHWLYQARAFFDYGGALFIYPMAELPYWRVAMARQAQRPDRAAFAAAHPSLLEQVRAELRARGPLGNRDFEGGQRVNSYRGRKDTALALYHLWITGEVMIHHRRRFERFYDLTERVAPPALQHTAPTTEAEAFLVRKAIAFVGLTRLSGWRASVAYYLQRPVTAAAARAWLAQLVEEGSVAPVRLAGDSEMRYALAQDVPALEALETGQLPDGWQPLTRSTEEEVIFLAPLDIVSARGRAKKLFDFDYVWEVYKPAAARRWGYYTLPVLYGDRLVARLDPRLERQEGVLRLLGFWLEADAPATDPAFGLALGRGLARLAQLAGVRQVDSAAIQPPALRAVVQAALSEEIPVAPARLTGEAESLVNHSQSHT